MGIPSLRRYSWMMGSEPAACRVTVIDAQSAVGLVLLVSIGIGGWVEGGGSGSFRVGGGVTEWNGMHFLAAWAFLSGSEGLVPGTRAT